MLCQYWLRVTFPPSHPPEREATEFCILAEAQCLRISAEIRLSPALPLKTGLTSPRPSHYVFMSWHCRDFRKFSLYSVLHVSQAAHALPTGGLLEHLRSGFSRFRCRCVLSRARVLHTGEEVKTSSLLGGERSVAHRRPRCHPREPIDSEKLVRCARRLVSRCTFPLGSRTNTRTACRGRDCRAMPEVSGAVGRRVSRFVIQASRGCGSASGSAVLLTLVSVLSSLESLVTSENRRHEYLPSKTVALDCPPVCSESAPDVNFARREYYRLVVGL